MLPKNWTLTQCLFGEHLLAKHPDAKVALVESEKTAVIAAGILPKYIWLATGGKFQFNARLSVLKGRTIIAFPDVDGYDLWRRKAAEMRELQITVSDLLERVATPEDKKNHIDIAVSCAVHNQVTRLVAKYGLEIITLALALRTSFPNASQ